VVRHTNKPATLRHSVIKTRLKAADVDSAHDCWLPVSANSYQLQ